MAAEEPRPPPLWSSESHSCIQTNMNICWLNTADHVHHVKRKAGTRTKCAGPFNRNFCVPINENPRAINVYWSVPGANCGISQQARALGGERSCGLSVFFKRSISIVHNPPSALRSSNWSQRPLDFHSKASPAARTVQYLSRYIPDLRSADVL